MINVDSGYGSEDQIGPYDWVDCKTGISVS